MYSITFIDTSDSHLSLQKKGMTERERERERETRTHTRTHRSVEKVPQFELAFNTAACSILYTDKLTLYDKVAFCLRFGQSEGKLKKGRKYRRGAL